MEKRASTLCSPPGWVLIVDDDAAVGNALKFALEQEGLSVRLYRGGEELLADPNLPARGCLVIDYSMPGMNGIDLISRLRQRHVGLPSILIIAHATGAVRDRAALAGFMQVLEKPLTDESLIDCIRGALVSQADASEHLRRTP
jgi:FixJ family two-component response regulator